MTNHHTMTWLDKLQSQLKIDIDCMNPAEAKRFLPFKPYDQTSNQRLVFEQMTAPENRDLFQKTVEEGRQEGPEKILDRLSALMCARNLENLRGRVLLQTSAFYAYDTDKIVAHARSYVAELEKVGVSRERVCIKIPATGPALNASPILLKEGIRTLGTSLFSVAQAVAASQAGCLSISPYLNYKQQWLDVDDPALDHPMMPRIAQIQHVFKQLAQKTGQTQPMLKPASFISAREAMAVGELGCDHATIPENILLELSMLDVATNTPPGQGSTHQDGSIPERLARLLTTDPLAGTDWDGVQPSTDVDYLANNGAALEAAIAADATTARGVHEALKAFEANELQSRAAIEELLRQALSCVPSGRGCCRRL